LLLIGCGHGESNPTISSL